MTIAALNPVSKTRKAYVAPMRKVPDTLCIPHAEGYTFMKWSEIEYCKAQGNYCMICRRNGETHIVSKTLKQVVEILPQSDFLRPHQSYVVNRQDVRDLSLNLLQLTSGIKVPLARARRGEISNALNRNIAIP